MILGIIGGTTCNFKILSGENESPVRCIGRHNLVRRRKRSKFMCKFLFRDCSANMMLGDMSQLSQETR
ncbi:unnamed protein product [Linum tenue]|uniref:Uncharacterized protein n=1 Tax=Linum tenue TaxID=586396 RepID=A0AAV0HET8_9ROSI|nr:unnamed protein product [Linum tenue]